MLRFINRTIVLLGPGHQLRYASVPLLLVNVRGGLSSTSTTSLMRWWTARWYPAATPAIPAPQITTSAFVLVTLLNFYRLGSHPLEAHVPRGRGQLHALGAFPHSSVSSLSRAETLFFDIDGEVGVQQAAQ